MLLLLFPADIYSSAICGYKDLLRACGISSVNVYTKRPSFDSVSLGDRQQDEAIWWRAKQCAVGARPRVDKGLSYVPQTILALRVGLLKMFAKLRSLFFFFFITILIWEELKLGICWLKVKMEILRRKIKARLKMWAEPPQECHEWGICIPPGRALSSCWALTPHSLVERQGQAPASSHPLHHPFYGRWKGGRTLALSFYTFPSFGKLLLPLVDAYIFPVNAWHLRREGSPNKTVRWDSIQRFAVLFSILTH